MSFFGAEVESVKLKGQQSATSDVRLGLFFPILSPVGKARRLDHKLTGMHSPLHRTAFPKNLSGKMRQERLVLTVLENFSITLFALFILFPHFSHTCFCTKHIQRLAAFYLSLVSGMPMKN